MIEKLTIELVDKIIVEINKEDTNVKIQTKIINPILYKIFSKLSPYLFLIFIMYMLNIILIIIVLIKYNKI